MAPHSLQQDVSFTSAWPCNTALPNGTLGSDAHFPIYKEHLLAALHNGNADGKRCSNACVTELRFITSEVAIPNGTAFIAALYSLHISMTLQHCASQRSASDQMHIFLPSKSIFWQHFTMETLTAKIAAKPVSWTSFYHPWSSITQRHSLQQDVPFIAAWPCNTALPNGTLTIRCTFSYL